MPKRKRWTEEEMMNAIDLAKTGESLRKVCATYSVPRTILRNRLKLGDPQRTGPKHLLTDYEEEQLVKYVQYMSKTHFAVSIYDIIISNIQRFAKHSNFIQSS